MARFLLDPRRLVRPVPRDDRATRFAQLATGLVLYGVSSSMLVLSGLGLDPWDVLHQGLARSTGIRIGTWVILVGILVLLLWVPLRQRPGLGTLCNVVVIGVVMNLVLGAVSAPEHLAARWACLVG